MTILIYKEMTEITKMPRLWNKKKFTGNFTRKMLVLAADLDKVHSNCIRIMPSYVLLTKQQENYVRNILEILLYL